MSISPIQRYIALCTVAVCLSILGAYSKITQLRVELQQHPRQHQVLTIQRL